MDVVLDFSGAYLRHNLCLAVVSTEYDDFTVIVDVVDIFPVCLDDIRFVDIFDLKICIRMITG